MGLYKFGLGRLARRAEYVPPLEPLTLFLMLRAFASGGAALTGVEAISDGVPAFQKPEWVNAQKTLTAMVVILAVTFAGDHLPGAPHGHRAGIAETATTETVVSQIARGRLRRRRRCTTRSSIRRI